MKEESAHPVDQRPVGATVVAVVNGIGCILTILFWGMVLVGKLIPWPGELTVMSERANAATTYGFMIGDILSLENTHAVQLNISYTLHYEVTQ